MLKAVHFKGLKPLIKAHFLNMSNEDNEIPDKSKGILFIYVFLIIPLVF